MRDLIVVLVVTLAGCAPASFDIAASDLAVVDDADPAAQLDAPELHDAAALEAAPVDAPELHDAAALEAAPVDASTCAECYGTCSTPDQDHPCFVQCHALAKRCTYKPGVCGCND